MPEDENVMLDTPNEPVSETVETPAIPTDEDILDIPVVDVAKIQETNKKLYARLKEAEAKLKAKESQPVSNVSPQPNVEETVLLANGMAEELVNELKVIAKVRGTTLLKAQNDPIFVAVKEKFEKDLRQKQANLGASRGSGQVKPKKDITTPGLTREEHMAMSKAI